LEVPYRFLVCGNYTAFYKVDGDEVHIIRVLYGRRNFMQILFGKSYDE
ncbi:MAG: type II toxin-antitoxin system RelE/ParE family toxin, partial [Ruminococcaceae bacterium]|nr:type II toxin-antitoxin system RelE/ParE family toxin [Oscillospiraceae bacterium]